MCYVMWTIWGHGLHQEGLALSPQSTPEVSHLLPILASSTVPLQGGPACVPWSFVQGPHGLLPLV